VTVDLSADPRYAEALGHPSQTVPEFGSIAALVLVIAVISIIAITKSRLKLSY
jgi:predicted secreted protein with PEFG-CTERM motif